MRSRGKIRAHRVSSLIAVSWALVGRTGSVRGMPFGLTFQPLLWRANSTLTWHIPKREWRLNLGGGNNHDLGNEGRRKDARRDDRQLISPLVPTLRSHPTRTKCFGPSVSRAGSPQSRGTFH